MKALGHIVALLAASGCAGDSRSGISGRVRTAMRSLLLSMILASSAKAQLLKPEPAAVSVTSSREFRDVVSRLKVAVENDDRREVATLVVFPLAVIKGKSNGSTYVPSVRVFMVNYKTVFNKKIRDALLAQNPDSLKIESGVARVGRGELTIGTRCSSTTASSCVTGVTSINYFEK